MTLLACWSVSLLACLSVTLLVCWAVAGPAAPGKIGEMGRLVRGGGAGIGLPGSGLTEAKDLLLRSAIRRQPSSSGGPAHKAARHALCACRPGLAASSDHAGRR